MDGIQMFGEAAFNAVDSITPTAFDDAMGYQAAQMDAMMFNQRVNAEYQAEVMQDIADKQRLARVMNSIPSGGGYHTSSGVLPIVGCVIAVVCMMLPLIAYLFGAFD